MEAKSKERILKVVIVLSLLGLLTSIYLLYSHYVPPASGTLCNYSNGISCSGISNSKYGSLFGVPVAAFGGMWFIILLSLAWKMLKKKEELSTFMLSWIILGVLFVIYMVIAEIILQTICPFCTVVHLLIIVVLVLGGLLYKAEEDVSKKSFLKVPGSWLKTIIIVNVCLILLFNFLPEKENPEAIAKCLQEKGVAMYSSYTCHVCIQQEALFGEAMQFIRRVECNPQGKNSQTALCQEKGIAGTPTWIMEKDGKEIKRKAGYMSLSDLKSFAWC